MSTACSDGCSNENPTAFSVCMKYCNIAVTFSYYNLMLLTGACTAKLVLLLFSSVFREMKKYQMDFSSWCGECQREKRERQIQCVKATKLVNHSLEHSYAVHLAANILLLASDTFLLYFRTGIS